MGSRSRATAGCPHGARRIEYTGPVRRTRGYALLWLIALVLPAVFARRASSQPVLSDSLYSAHHPRLLFTPAEIPALRAKVQDGGPDDGAYQFLRTWVQLVWPSQPIGFVLGPWYGLQSIPAAGLVGYLESPADSAAKAFGKMLTTYVLDTYEPDFDEAGSGMRLRALALGYDMCFGDATESERARIRDEMVLYIQRMTLYTNYQQFEYRPYLGNHSAMFGAALGLAAIALQGEADASLLSDAMAMADRIVDNLVAYQFDPGGAYNEGGLYSLWTTMNLVYYFDARKRYDGHALGDNPRLDALEEWLAYELLPEGAGRSHNLNDSPYWTTPFARNEAYFDWSIHERDSGLSAWLWEHVAGAYGADLGSESDKVARVLWHRPVPLVPPGSVLPLHRVWLQRGLYHFRTGWQSGASSADVVFCFYSGKFQGGHAQEDQNQFALYAYGEKFVIDHGSGSTAKESEAHNLVFVDGKGQHNAGGSIGTDGRIAENLLGGSADYLVGDATAAYGTYSEFNAPGQPFPGTDWSWGYAGANPVQFALRRVLVAHGGAVPPYFVVMDDIDKDGTPHAYEWRMHTHLVNTVNTAANPITIAHGAATMDVHLLNPPMDSVSITTQPFENDTPDPNSTVLRVTRTATNPRFSLLLMPRQNAAPAPNVTHASYPWGYACRIEWEGGIVDQFVRNDSGAAAVHGDIETDALVAWVRETSGVVSGYLAVGVSALAVGGTDYATIAAGTVTCEVSGPTIHLDRDDADFRFFDTGISQVFHDEQTLGFVVRDGYVVPVGTTAVGEAPAREKLAIAAYPNPFNPATTIRVEADAGARMRLAVYDVAGRRVRLLWNAPLRAASRSLVWDGCDDAGVPVASGTYFLRAAGDAGTRTIKLTIIK
jgi:Heparinase II/III-like protein